MRCIHARIAPRVLSIGNRWRRDVGDNSPWLYARREYHRYRMPRRL